MIIHPFSWIDPSWRNLIFWFSLVIAMAVMAFLQWVDTHLRPSGIVAFELAGSFEVVCQILEGWDSNAKAYARISLWVDFLFIASYTTTIGLGCVILADHYSTRIPAFAELGVILSWSMLVAACLDCAENYSLIRLLNGSNNHSLPFMASCCAAVKFVIIGICILYVLIEGLMFLYFRIAQK
jgi:hypothetical protein